MLKDWHVIVMMVMATLVAILCLAITGHTATLEEVQTHSESFGIICAEISGTTCEDSGTCPPCAYDSGVLSCSEGVTVCEDCYNGWECDDGKIFMVDGT